MTAAAAGAVPKLNGVGALFTRKEDGCCARGGIVVNSAAVVVAVPALLLVAGRPLPSTKAPDV